MIHQIIQDMVAYHFTSFPELAMFANLAPDNRRIYLHKSWIEAELTYRFFAIALQEQREFRARSTVCNLPLDSQTPA